MTDNEAGHLAHVTERDGFVPEVPFPEEADEQTPEPQVVIHFANGSKETFDLSEFKRIEIPLSHGQDIWVERPEPIWYWNHEPSARVMIMGGPQGRGIFAPESANTQLLVAIPSTYAKKED